MNQTIDPIKLKAAAAHLEWVLQQYPDSEEVQGLLRALTPLIESAKSRGIESPIDSNDVPGAYNFAQGLYMPFETPNVGGAYSDFIDELRGGLTEQDRQILAQMQTMRDRSRGHG